MKKYQFLVKPATFILSVFFSAWLTLKIEKIKPSDFGSYKSLFEKETKEIKFSKATKSELRNLFSKYKSGQIDSIKLESELEKISISVPDTSSINTKSARF